MPIASAGGGRLPAGLVRFERHHRSCPCKRQLLQNVSIKINHVLSQVGKDPKDASRRSGRHHGHDLGGPLDGDIPESGAKLGDQIIPPLCSARLQLSQNDDAVSEADDANIAEEIGCHRVAYFVQNHQPAVEERPQAMIADLADDARIGIAVGPFYFIEISWRNIVIMRFRTGSDVSHDMVLGRSRFLELLGWKWDIDLSLHLS